MKNIRLNVLALVSVVFGFLYNAFIGRVFGISKELDLYFAAYTLIVYAGIFSQIFYECFIAYYADMKVLGKEESDRLYSTLINQTFLFSAVIIFLLNSLAQVLAKVFLGAPQYVNIIYIMSVFIVLQNFFLINRNIITMNFRFAVAYICDILIFITSFGFILLYDKKWGVYTLIYALLISYAFAVLMQFLFVFRILRIKYYLQIRHVKTLEILKGSLMVKAGAILYGLKDVIISNVLLGAGTGAYSIYSYANKFSSAVNSVINAPSISVFTSKVNFIASKKEFAKLPGMIKSVLLKITLLFSICTAATYMVIPYFVVYFMNVTRDQSLSIQNIFLLLSLYYLFMTMDAPFSRTISAFKKFNLVFFTNTVFFIIFLVIIMVTPHTAVYAVISLIVAQLSNVTLYVFFVIKALKKEGIGHEVFGSDAGL